MDNRYKADCGIQLTSGNALIRTMHVKQLYDATFKELQKELELTQIEVSIMLFLENHKEYNTQRDLCNIRMLPKSNASNGIRLLERKGLIRIEFDPENKKLHRLFLTAKADNMIKLLKREQQMFLTKILGSLTVEEREMFERISDKVDKQVMIYLNEYNCKKEETPE